MKSSVKQLTPISWNGTADIFNIPWVKPDRQYVVRALFKERHLGSFTGRQLQRAGVDLALPAYGQEILELAPKDSQ